MNYQEAKAYVEKNNIFVGDTVILEPYGAICEYKGLESEAINDGTGYVEIYLCNQNAKKVPFDKQHDIWINPNFAFHKKVDLTKLSKTN